MQKFYLLPSYNNYEVEYKLMLDVHNNSAPSNITKPFVRTSNNYT